MNGDQVHEGANYPKLAILFWWYKKADICKGRLEMLRRLNPEIPIFGLYGGELESFAMQTALLTPLLNDSWAFPEDKDSAWKWHHGDLMLNAWHRNRGMDLEWDTLIIMQWDMLAFAPLRQIFCPLAKDEIYLPGLRPFETLAQDWWWIQPNTPQGAEFECFKAMMSERYNFHGPYQACQFVTGALPRVFMNAYADIPEEELGFLEYKMPAFASMLGLSFCKLPNLDITWPKDLVGKKRVSLTAAKREINDWEISAELFRVGGARLFHPISRRFPSTMMGITKWMVGELMRKVSNYLITKFS